MSLVLAHSNAHFDRHPGISLGKPSIEHWHHGGKSGMFRLSLYVLGVSAFAAAWAVYRNQQKKKPIPASKAAAMLQQAWGNHHTYA
ncbi:MAG: hypothetical protein WBQ95_07800 [Terracidiphilus sp.]